jgi:hypothetical protein
MTKKTVEFDAELVRDISVHVYRQRLSSVDLDAMTTKVGAAGIRKNAAAYDALTRCYLRAVPDILGPGACP